MGQADYARERLLTEVTDPKVTVGIVELEKLDVIARTIEDQDLQARALNVIGVTIGYILDLQEYADLTSKEFEKGVDKLVDMVVDFCETLVEGKFRLTGQGGGRS